MVKTLLLCALLFIAQDEAKGDEPIENLQFQMSFKSGYNPYRIFGDIPLPPKASRFRSPLYFDCPCNIKHAETVHVQVKVGSVLRYNLIKVFGYILHRKQIELNTAYYTSLHFIIICIKLNHIDIISLTGIIHEIAFASVKDQFVKLFEAMEAHLPSYLTCAATFWKEGIKKNEIDIEKILIPYNDKTLVVNLLEGISPSEALRVHNATNKKVVPANDKEKRILYDFNPSILRLFQILESKKSATVTPWVMVGILQFLPRTLIQPDLEESIQVMVQYLYERNVSDFKNVKMPKDKTDPHNLIEFYLHILAKSTKVEDPIKETTQVIIRNLQHRNPTAVNPHFISFTYFIQPDHIKVDAMLKYISKGAFPLEIVLAADRVRFYIDQLIIGYKHLMINFNPYLYSTPTEVLIALLDRIMRRQPELAPEVLDSVGAVYSFLIFKYRYSTMPLVYPTDMINMNVLFLGFKAPDIKKSIRDSINTLEAMMQSEPINYSQILMERVPIYKCTTPVVCFIHLLLELKNMKQMLPEEVVRIIIVIVESGCLSGSCGVEDYVPGQLYPETRFDGSRRVYELPDEFKTPPAATTVTTPKPTTTTTTTPTQPPPTTPTEGSVHTAGTSPATSPTTPTAPKPKQTTDVPWIDIAPTANDVTPENETAIIIIFKNLTREYRNVTEEQVRKMYALLESERFREIIHKEKHYHVVLITLYLSALEQMKLEYSDKDFIKVLEKFIETQEKTKEILEKITIEPRYEEPALFKLTIALPAPNESEMKKFELLKAVLSKQELFKIIHEKIKAEEMSSVGTLLTAVLREEAKLTNRLTKEELEAVKYYIGKVEKHGFAEAKISYVVTDQKRMKAGVEIATVMDNALDFESLENSNKKDFNAIIEYFQQNPQFLNEWDKWYFYPKSGEFTKAMFQHILSTPSVKPKVREAVLKLTPKINLDKNGEKPAFEINYEKQK